jgi:hypothetical protein
VAPTALHPDPKRALVVVMGGGATVGALSRHTETQIDTMELAESVVHGEATLWTVPPRDGVLLVGATRSLRLERAAFERKLADPTTRTALAAVGLADFDALLARYWAGPAELRAYVGPGEVLTDDRPLVEYFLSLPRGERPRDVAAVRGDVRRLLIEPGR